MNYFIDSNIFLRAAMKSDDKSFAECTKFLELVEKNKIDAVSCSLVLAEVVWVVKSFYGMPRSQQIRIARSILNLKAIKWVEKYNPSIALELYSGNSVKFIDTLIASLPGVQTRKWTIVSYDRDFDKLGVLRKEPQDLVRNL